MRVAGIVVYNPDMERLRQNIQAIYSQIDKLLIYQNSSFDSAFLEEYNKIVRLNNGNNDGLGIALNSIMAYAADLGADWCLLLDQDSVVSSGFFDGLEAYCNLKKAGIITPNIIDEYDRNNHSCADGQDIETINMCITSGSLNNVKIWKETGGFRNEYFIDYIDWEYCARIRKQGYHVYRINHINLYHELGKRTYHRVLNFTVYTFNHNAFRKYYITRNTIVTYRLYPFERALAHPYLRTWKRLIIALLFEEKKMEKAKAIAKGVLDSKKLYRILKGNM